MNPNEDGLHGEDLGPGRLDELYVFNRDSSKVDVLHWQGAGRMIPAHRRSGPQPALPAASESVTASVALLLWR